MSELPKTFDPASIEARWYAFWEENGHFRPDRPGAEPWTIVNPPPNVTGSLHIGHALDNTLQDVLARHARLQGKDARWVVGMDHAGIATQMVVERQLNEKQQKRTDFTRDEFVAKVWEWKAESGGAIIGQLKRLGCSMDWANERFTMDEGFSKAVLKVFVDLYNQGLLYRDKRLVNWDPGLGTAISDLEVETVEVNGHFWQIRYPLADGSGSIVVATTRPETMLADMAVAVHPEDERYKAMIGSQVKLPITGRLVPVIGDEHADPELGTGAVKITPGHDFNDFEVGKRAGMKPAEMLNMLDAKANITQTSDGLIPAELIGMERFAARKRVVEMLKDGGFLVAHVDKDGNEHDAEPRKIQTPYGDRSNVVIEPWLTDQWYVDAATLAKPAIEAVRSGATKIVPKSWEKTYFNWMENIQPWCVSRQLWWGHRIPAWFGPELDGDTLKMGVSQQQPGRFPSPFNSTGRKIFVAETEEEALEQARQYYGDEQDIVIGDVAGIKPKTTADGLPNFFAISLARDPDVLDTWFSSALWPFATMGWPDADVKAMGRYPNDVLISGFDILFFWDARMMMQGLHFMGEVPFKTLYLHGLVRAADGQKMSKSKGNVVNPLGLIDKYGADALRFFMAATESQGRDIKMDEKRVEGYRNFATKLWNAARFCQANGIGASATIDPPQATLPVNRWIVGETVKTVQALDIALAELRFDESANTIYQFTWATFCDWYLELIKPVSIGDERGQIDEETKVVAGWVLDQILVMLHPFMPFVTEELWNALGERAYPLILAKWPMPDARALHPEATQEIEDLIQYISGIRTQRTETGFNPSDKIPVSVTVATPEKVAVLNRHLKTIERMARVQPATIEIGSHSSGTSWSVALQDKFELVEQINRTGFVTAQFLLGDVTVVAFTDGFIDLAAEKARLTKAAEAAEKERDSLAGRLNNPSFVERAKPEAVEKARADHAEKASDAEKYRAALARLG